MPARDVYISIGVEADGPIPIAYSMTSLGMCVAGTFDGTRYQRRDPSADTFYRELRPISDRWDPEALAVGGFTRDALVAEGADPAVAIPDAIAWIEQVSGGMKPVLVAYPLTFDAAYWHAYAVLYNDGADPFGHASHLDMKTMYQTEARSLMSPVDKAIDARASAPEPLPAHPQRTGRRDGPRGAVLEPGRLGRRFPTQVTAACMLRRRPRMTPAIAPLPSA